jgi:SAM-dependent methyltransferase
MTLNHNSANQQSARLYSTEINNPQFIEILPVSLLDENRATVVALKQLADSLGLEFGWHYLLDLTWVLKNLGPLKNKFIMDAGAGTGIMQWFLATQGAEVLSVDRGSRAALPVRFRRRFNVAGLRQAPQPDLLPTAQLFSSIMNNPKKALVQAREFLGGLGVEKAPGRVIIYNQDLKALVDVLDNSLDAVVAISALEHNAPEDLPVVVAELMRVLKPGGVLLATLCAGRDQDWFHTPSAGWCYTDASLKRLFSLPADAPSNYLQYDELLEALRDCAELRDHLAAFYAHSGDNGMPWGKWDPQYQAVGVCKIK